MEISWGEVFRGKVVVVGIGNILRGDDAFGPRMIENLAGKTDAALVDAGAAPESFVGKITRSDPDTVLLVDACSMGKRPGEYSVLEKNDLLKCGFTTHDISPNLFIEFLESQTSARIFLLGVQPLDVSTGSEMSEPVARTLEDLTTIFLENIGCTSRT